MFEGKCLGHLEWAITSDWGIRVRAADDAISDEGMNLIDEVSIEASAEDAASSFDENVGAIGLTKGMQDRAEELAIGGWGRESG